MTGRLWRWVVDRWQELRYDAQRGNLWFQRRQPLWVERRRRRAQWRRK